MTKETFPAGLKIQEKEGSGELNPQLSKLKKYSFNGYIYIEAKERLKGYITLKDGRPRNAIIITPSKKEIHGVDALEKIRGWDKFEDIRIEVHTNIDIDKLISETGGKITEEELESQEEVFTELEERVEEEIEEEGEEEVEKEADEEEEKKKIEKEYQEKELEEKEIEVYDMVIKEGKKKKEEEKKGPFSENYSFDHFVVGPNNKFAYAAATEVAKSPGSEFNPLFITSPAGMGKTHLLKGIGRYIEYNHPDLNLRYTTTAKLASDLSKEDSKKATDEVKDDYYNIDVLLLDDVQFLAGRDELQEEIFHIFNEVKSNNGQVVLSSDRPPEDIPSLENRLVSRFKSGLVVDISSPTYETRYGIIEEKLKNSDITLDEDIKEYLAKNITKNIRELEGALNRILAFSSLLKQEITLESVKQSLAGQKEDKQKRSESKKVEFKEGRSYLVEEERADKGFKVFRDHKKGKQKYIFSRMNPSRIKEDFRINDAGVFWLTGKESTDFDTISPNLESLTWQLEEVLSDGSLILLDGLEYLISNSGFDATIQFLRHMVDTVSESGAIFVLTVSPNALERRQVSILEREMEVISLTEE
ncbi:MAG: DnaA ATPase domain-containing protein [Thermoplasmatota archaeon]